MEKEDKAGVVLKEQTWSFMILFTLMERFGISDFVELGVRYAKMHTGHIFFIL